MNDPYDEDDGLREYCQYIGHTSSTGKVGCVVGLVTLGYILLLVLMDWFK